MLICRCAMPSGVIFWCFRVRLLVFVNRIWLKNILYRTNQPQRYRIYFIQFYEWSLKWLNKIKQPFTLIFLNSWKISQLVNFFIFISTDTCEYFSLPSHGCYYWHNFLLIKCKFFLSHSPIIRTTHSILSMEFRHFFMCPLWQRKIIRDKDFFIIANIVYTTYMMRQRQTRRSKERKR